MYQVVQFSGERLALHRGTEVKGMDGRVVAAYLFGIFFLFIIGRAFSKPLHILLRVVLNLLAGILVLWGLNLIGGIWRVTVPMNPFTALVAGSLGLPGVGLLLLLKYVIL